MIELKVDNSRERARGRRHATRRPPGRRKRSVMWKRLQGREKGGKSIGQPTLLETTYDEDQLRHIPSVQTANYEHNVSAQRAGFVPQSFEPTPVDYRVSEVPTESSFYSQPSPRFRYSEFESNPAEAPPAFVDVSPPSSPEPDHLQQQQQSPDQAPRRFRSMRDVSPVDEKRGQPMGEPSNIPVLRKMPSGMRDQDPQGTQKFWGGKVAPGSKVKWDEYSGEPTSGNRGKASQVSPRSYALPTLKGSERRQMTDPAATGNSPESRRKQSLAERAKRYGPKPAPVDTSRVKPRVEPWSRASGRMEIAQPLKDQRSERPLEYSRRKNPEIIEEESEKGPAGVSSANAVPDTLSVTDEDLSALDPPENPIKPITPLKVGGTTPPRSLASPTSPNNPATQAAYSYPSPTTPTNAQHSALRSVSGQQPKTPTNAKVPRKSIESTPGSHGEGPESRFSWTTYNTSTTYQQSPPPSPPPPMPNTSALRAPGPVPAPAPIPAAQSILARRRPLAPADSIPTRKPISSGTASIRTTMTTDPPSPRPMSTFSTSTQKALPPPPTEVSAADHVEILEAQLEELKLRRRNVGRLLDDLNKAAPPNPLVTDFKRMRLVEKRKKEFEGELAEIRHDEHDVGLKLHRALRKREKDDPNGSESALWVRRVTR